MCVLVQLVVKYLKYSPKLVKEERRGLDAKARHKNTTAHFADELCRFSEAMRQVFFPMGYLFKHSMCGICIRISKNTHTHEKKRLVIFSVRVLYSGTTEGMEAKP